MGTVTYMKGDSQLVECGGAAGLLLLRKRSVTHRPKLGQLRQSFAGRACGDGLVAGSTSF